MNETELLTEFALNAGNVNLAKINTIIEIVNTKVFRYNDMLDQDIIGFYTLYGSNRN